MDYQPIFTKEKSFSYKIIDNIHTYVWGGRETTIFFFPQNIYIFVHNITQLQVKLKLLQFQ
jgi:hypothetical protein